MAKSKAPVKTDLQIVRAAIYHLNDSVGFTKDMIPNLCGKLQKADNSKWYDMCTAWAKDCPKDMWHQLNNVYSVSLKIPFRLELVNGEYYLFLPSDVQSWGLTMDDRLISYLANNETLIRENFAKLGFELFYSEDSSLNWVN